ncbi:MAG: flagellar hook-associated protein FlgK [Gammaproteobacteria bacterium]|nr:flagellar hook-associated protein FlgK [Gammaproteobacteria bacterium]
MGNSLFGIGVSALQTSQRALSTVSHNIANVNNPAFSRQRNDITARAPQFIDGGFKGTGVQVSDIRRSVNQFLVADIRSGTANLERLNTVNDLASRLDNLVASPDAGLSPAIDAFFSAVQDVANDPVSTAPRSVLLSQADALVERFAGLDGQFASIESSINSRVGQAVSLINGFAENLATLNGDIRRAVSVSTNSQPNDLLDQRDELLRQLSELVDVAVLEQADRTVNVSIGSGQPIVVDTFANRLAVTGNEFDPTRSEVALANVPGNPVISQFIRGGELGGLLEVRETLIDPARNIFGRIAVGLADTVNAQHRQGLDLQGNLGGAFFNDLADTSAAVSASSRNTGTAAVEAVITDIGQLTTSDYRLERNGSTFSLTRLSDGVVTNVSADFTGLPAAATTTVDGIELTVTGTVDEGDGFLIRPTRFAARDLATEISNPLNIAAGSPAASAAAVDNAGLGAVSPAAVVDPVAYAPDDYEIVLADATGAAGGGRGTFSDTGIDDTLTLGYDLSIDGVIVYRQNVADIPLADAAAIAAEINDDTVTTGVRALVEGGSLFLTRDPATTGDIVVRETLTGASDAGDTITGYFGGALSGAADTSELTFSAAADSYVVLDGGANAIASDAYSSGAPIEFSGIRVAVEGEPVNGDVFTVTPNTFGVGDNRNALALADLQIATVLNGGTANFQDAYGELVVQIGGTTREAGINLSAQRTLLDNTQAARSAVSGVNLDEEAADLLLFQQSYQAAARIISTADTIFQELLSVTRG